VRQPDRTIAVQWLVASTDGEVTRQARPSWEVLAPVWERHRTRIFESTRPISERLVELVDSRPGDTILEVAAGTGETGFLLADRLGAEGRLICSDFSEAMVRAAERVAAQRGLTNVEFQHLDAQAIDLPDRSVDGVISRFGLMLVPEPRRALAEAHRVLRTPGRLAYAVWGPPDRNPWITLLGGVLLQRGHTLGGDPFGPGGLFSLAEAEENVRLATDAGFHEIAVEEISGAMHVDDPGDYWEFQTSISGLATLVTALPPDEQDALRTAFVVAAQPFRANDDYRLPYCAVVLHAMR
jgi:SAM-dependent methyltransferase